MSSFDVDSALKKLDEIAYAEYGTDFTKAIKTPDEELTLRRMARLTGIELKYPFAKSQPLSSGRLETGARQQWVLRPELINPTSPGGLGFEQLKGNPSYETEANL